MRITTVAIFSLSAGCLASEPQPEPVGSLASAPTPGVLEHAAGTWIERPVIADSELTARCPGCELAIVHRLSADYRDAIAVYAVGGDGVIDGAALCTRTRTYYPSANQTYRATGELVDYELTADTCGSSAVGVVSEDYALWIASGSDGMQVIEEPPPPGQPVQGFRPFNAWWRCGADPSPLCGATALTR
jgi:hypothetical protein